MIRTQNVTKEKRHGKFFFFFQGKLFQHYTKAFKGEISQLKRSFFLKRLWYTYIRGCQLVSVFQSHLNFTNSK